jgi:hypothetical protein
VTETADENDVEEVRELLSIVSEKIPALLNSLTDVLYGTEAAAKYGQAVAGFYRNLRDSGMTEDQAFELTKTYMANLNLAGMIGKFLRKPMRGGEAGDVDVEIRERVEEKLREKFEREE